MGMNMVTKGMHNAIEFLSDDSPDMDVIGISDNFFSDINKPAALLAKIQPKTWRALKLMEAINSSHRTITISTITEDTIIENHGKDWQQSSGRSVLGDNVDEECAAADPPEISDAQNNRKRCRE
ncbi:hypothetical protein F2Q70_00012370 [Brassica cretica]|uniref:Uncharacterized protein n=1 Tax=Brassica cretica TaxID=69181 RepID=A0A8S9LUR0_BRACR|nr:hypothetical protein F2Q70_00012370 [Brassica cretica]